MAKKTSGGRTLRTTYSVQFNRSTGKYFVGAGSSWGATGLTLFEARAEVRRRNAALK